MGTPRKGDGNELRLKSSKDGQITIVQTAENQLQVREVSTGRILAAPQLSNRYLISHAISSDGKTVITGCDDNTVQIWDVATGWPLAAPWQHQVPLVCVAITAENQAISGGSDEQSWQWPQAAAATDQRQRLRLSVEVRTGRTWQQDGTTRRLAQHEWLARMSQLQQLGGLGDAPSNQIPSP